MLKLFDEEKHPHIFDEVDLDDPSIAVAYMAVIQGAEALTIISENGFVDAYVTNEVNNRIRMDDYYVLLVNGKWVVDKDTFLDRKDPFWRTRGQVCITRSRWSSVG